MGQACSCNDKDDKEQEVRTDPVSDLSIYTCINLLMCVETVEVWKVGSH